MYYYLTSIPHPLLSSIFSLLTNKDDHDHKREIFTLLFIQCNISCYRPNVLNSLVSLRLYSVVQKAGTAHIFAFIFETP